MNMDGFAGFITDDAAKDTTITDRWWREHTPRRIDTPLKRLMFAILQQAMATVINANVHGGFERKAKSGLSAAEQHQLRQAEHDREWFADSARWDVTSFNMIFSTLYPDYDLERARREILKNPARVRRRIKALRGFYGRMSLGGKEAGDGID